MLSMTETLSALFEDQRELKRVHQRNLAYLKGVKPLDELDFQRLSKGIEVDIAHFDDYIGEDNIPRYKERNVVLYIHDQKLPPDKQIAKKWQPYHICKCASLRRAVANNRFANRYVAKLVSGKDEEFEIFPASLTGTPMYKKPIKVKLKVCQDCLRELNWNRFLDFCGAGENWFKNCTSAQRLRRYQIVESFDMEKFNDTVFAARFNFEDMMPNGTSMMYLGQEYSAKMTAERKLELKKQHNYTCSRCRIKFVPKALEIHHKDHCPGNNMISNLEVVCCDCHTKIHRMEGGVREG